MALKQQQGESMRLTEKEVLDHETAERRRSPERIDNDEDLLAAFAGNFRLSSCSSYNYNNDDCASLPPVALERSQSDSGHITASSRRPAASSSSTHNRTTMAKNQPNCKLAARHYRQFDRSFNLLDETTSTAPTLPCGLDDSSTNSLFGGGAGESSGGVFVSTRSLFRQIRESSAASTNSMDDSLSSFGSAASCWTSSGSVQHHKGSPLLVTSPDSDGPEIKDKARALGEIIVKSRKLPSCASGDTSSSQHDNKNNNTFASNHIMVNQERIKRKIAPLTRLHELDEMARAHAELMATQGRVFHSDPVQLHQSFHRAARRWGENCERGTDIREIHHSIMMERSRSDKNNILDRRYCSFGMASVRSQKDGLLYLCQVFRG